MNPDTTWRPSRTHACPPGSLSISLRIDLPPLLSCRSELVGGPNTEDMRLRLCKAASSQSILGALDHLVCLGDPTPMIESKTIPDR